MLSDIQKKASELQEIISCAVKDAHQKAIARRQEESLFLLTAAHEKRVRDLLGAETFHNDEVVKLLQNSAEEDLVEEECLKRYEHFLRTKAVVFSDCAMELKLVAESLAYFNLELERAGTSESGDRDNVVDISDHNNQLEELRRLWQVTEQLHHCTAGRLLESFVVPTDSEEGESCLKDRNLESVDARMQETIGAQEQLLSSAKSRLAAAEEIYVNLRAELESVCGCNTQTSQEPFHVEKDCTSSHFQNSIDALHATTRKWVLQRQRLDSTKSYLCDELSAVTRSTEACRQSKNALLANAEEIEDSVAQLKAVCDDLAQQLRRLEHQRCYQEQLLYERMSSYDALKKQLSQLAEHERIKAAELNSAEYVRRNICTDIENMGKQIEIMSADGEKLEAQLKSTFLMKNELYEEVQYLAGLIPDRQVAEMLLSTAAKHRGHGEASLPTSGYLLFLKKARNLRRLSLSTE